jgi:regulator of cell morphogenesis and NO signaling
MHAFAASQPVGEIVAHFPGASRLFERHAIDYCCGGRRPLAEACAERGLDAQVLIEELHAAEAGAGRDELRDRTGEPLADLIEHLLVAYHAPLRADLPRLARLAGRALEHHPEGGMLPFDSIAAHLAELQAELESHMLKEERVLFPAVRRLESAGASGAQADEPCGSIAFPIRAMEHEHAEAGDHLAALHRLTGGYDVPAGACATVTGLVEGLADLEIELHRHIHLENEILFPRALALAARRPGELES